MKRIYHGSKQWVESKLELLSSTVFISQCKDCGAAVASGYCCNTCGSVNPSEKSEDALPFDPVLEKAAERVDVILIERKRK